MIKNYRGLGYHVTCQIKSNKRVLLNNQDLLSVKAYAKRFDKEDFKEISIKARGKRKSYFIVEQLVSLDKSSQVSLVISKEDLDAGPKYYICTDKDLLAKEILPIYEDRWDIETAHREANQKLVFKDYQLRSKKAIVRFMQFVFAIWTGILLVEIKSPPSGIKKKTLDDMVDQVRSESIVDLMVYVMDSYLLRMSPFGAYQTNRSFACIFEIL